MSCLIGDTWDKDTEGGERAALPVSSPEREGVSSFIKYNISV